MRLILTLWAKTAVVARRSACISSSWSEGSRGSAFCAVFVVRRLVCCRVRCRVPCRVRCRVRFVFLSSLAELQLSLRLVRPLEQRRWPRYRLPTLCCHPLAYSCFHRIHTILPSAIPLPHSIISILWAAPPLHSISSSLHLLPPSLPSCPSASLSQLGDLNKFPSPSVVNLLLWRFWWQKSFTHFF